MQPHTFRPDGVIRSVMLLAINHRDDVHSHHTAIQQQRPTDETTHIGIYGVQDGGLHFMDEVAVDGDLQQSILAALTIGEREAQHWGVDLDRAPWVQSAAMAHGAPRDWRECGSHAEWEMRGGCIALVDAPNEWDGSMLGFDARHAV